MPGGKTIAHGYLVLSLLTIPVALGRDELTMQEVQGGSLVPSSLAFFAPEEASRRMVALLSSFDLFSLWVIVLMIVGYHVAARVSKAAAAGVVIAILLISAWRPRARLKNRRNASANPV